MCREAFERTYPASVRIFHVVNMLICIKSYRVELRCPAALSAKSTGCSLSLFKGASAGADVNALRALEVVLVIDELRVISFDRFRMKMPQSVAYDDQVCIHLTYLRHFLIKQILIRSEFAQTPISSLPQRLALVANEERSVFAPATGARGYPHDGMLRGGPADKDLFDSSNVVQIRSDTSSSNLGGPTIRNRRNKKNATKKLNKLKENATVDGFQSCADSQTSLIDGLKLPEVPESRAGLKLIPEETRSEGNS